MKKLLLVFCVGLIGLTLSAQNHQHERCYTTHVVNHFNQQHPGYSDAVDQLYGQALEILESSASSNKTTSGHDTIFRIPVVFHMVYTDPMVDSLDEQLFYDQIEVLNRDFRRTNADTTNTRAEFLPVVGDAGIEFYLATTDPQGNPTTGITYTLGNPGFFGFEPFTDNVKSAASGGKDAWPTDQYLNIWVCNILNGLGVLGYAFPPAAAPNWPAGSSTDSSKQGVVIHYEVFGPNNPNATGPLSIADAGRTAVHEVGHFLGLRHVWGDGDCTEDDGINDTPTMADNSQSAGCSFTKNTCDAATPGDLPDMVENYMDYSTEQCQNSFTNGQISIMRSMLVIGRPGLAEIVTNSTSIGRDLTNSAELSVFPNPSNGKVMVQFIGENLLELSVIDIAGRTVWTGSDLEQQTQQVDLSGQATGVYLLRAKTTESIVTERIVLN
jgi:hypothetical protein